MSLRILSKKLQALEQQNKLYEFDVAQVLNYFTTLASAFNVIKKLKQDFLQIIMDSHADDRSMAVGIPGTLLNTYLSIVQIFESTGKQFNTRSQQIITKVTNSIGSLISDPERQLASTFAGMEECLNKLEGVNTMVQDLSSPKSDLIQNFAIVTNLLVKEPERRAEVKKLQKLFKDVLKARMKFDKNSAALTKTAQISIDKYRTLCAKVESVYNLRITVLTDLFMWVADIYAEIGKQLIANSERLNLYIGQMDYKADFTNYVSRSKLARYDIKDFKFRPFDTSGPAFDGINPSVPRSISFFSPLYFAQIIHSYNADGENELTCQKGKCLLLMEEPEMNWVYSMNPKTRRYGFVPKNCFKVVGNKLGILLLDFNEQSSYMNAGDFVGIIEETDKYYKIGNLENKILIVQKKFIGIIHS